MFAIFWLFIGSVLPLAFNMSKLMLIIGPLNFYLLQFGLNAFYSSDQSHMLNP